MVSVPPRLGFSCACAAGSRAERAAAPAAPSFRMLRRSSMLSTVSEGRASVRRAKVAGAVRIGEASDRGGNDEARQPQHDVGEEDDEGDDEEEDAVEGHGLTEGAGERAPRPESTRGA